MSVWTPSSRSTWLISAEEFSDDAFPEEATRAEKGLESAEHLKTMPHSIVWWLRLTGSSAFTTQAQPGDSLFCIWTALGTKRPRVYRRGRILQAQPEANCKRFYVETSARDEETGLSWSAFRKLAADRGLKRISIQSCREISAETAAAMLAGWKRA